MPLIKGEGNDLLLLLHWSKFAKGGGWCFCWWYEGGGLVVWSKNRWLLSSNGSSYLVVVASRTQVTDERDDPHIVMEEKVQ